MSAFNSINTRLISSTSSPNPITEPKKLLTLSFPSSKLFTLSNPSLNFTIAARTGPLLPINAVTDDREVDTADETCDYDQEKASTTTESEGIKNITTSISSERLLNAAIVLGAGTLAITKLLTIDHDYWHGWTLYEVLRYAPEHNWIAYEEALRKNPVFAKMVISGFVYSLRRLDCSML
ncbi:peroxisomal membrane protein 2 [Forsythia ovata]|uniref:Peroxisomal membrane protein 2 n=1 Tax=Forsythia ovata TaxID=205694 RepID=A0ABD1RZE1_9LAMI